jgi:hypothetical protein
MAWQNRALQTRRFTLLVGRNGVFMAPRTAPWRPAPFASLIHHRMSTFGGKADILLHRLSASFAKSHK